jgi:hypothetical protein
MEKTRFCTMMVRKHHRDCVWYLLANDPVVVEWWAECKAVCGIQWQEDMCISGESPGIIRKNSGIPKIGNKKSAHQARFPSSPINGSPNSVFSNYRQIRIIRTHWNSSESPNLVIRVTREMTSSKAPTESSTYSDVSAY